jgi:peptide/nickel transport system substrate-binding protein
MPRRTIAGNHRMTKICRVLLCLLALSVGHARAQERDTLTIGIAEFPSSLHPSLDPLLIKSYVLGYVLRQISSFDKSGLKCLICAELPTIDNGLAKIVDLPGGGRGMDVTMKIRPDLKWGDGVPVTAKDVLFTWKIGRDPASGFSNGLPWNRFSRVDAVDDKTVVFHLDKVMVNYNQWDQILPEHIEAPAYAQGIGAAEYIKNTTYNRAPLTPGLWNGPFIITGYQSGAQIVMEQNPYWPGPKPGFKRIVLRLIADTAALQANLMSGDVDIANNLTLDQVLALQKQKPDAFTYSYTPSLTYQHIDMNRDNPILADIRVRRALLMGIDRQTIIARLFDGRTPLANAFVSPLDPNNDPTLTPVAYSPAAARTLLAEAGWKPGPDGICRNAAGQKLSLDYLGASGFKVIELIQQVMQSQWKSICVETTLKSEPSRTLFGQTTKNRAFTGLVIYSWTSSVTEGPRRTLFSDQIPNAANNFGGANFVAYADKDMDADITAAEGELDAAKQKEIWSRMQKRYAEFLPALPLYFNAIPQALPKWLAGFEASGTGQPFTQGAENWRPN